MKLCNGVSNDGQYHVVMNYDDGFILYHQRGKRFSPSPLPLTPALIAWTALSTLDHLHTTNVSYDFVTRILRFFERAPIFWTGLNRPGNKASIHVPMDDGIKLIFVWSGLTSDDHRGGTSMSKLFHPPPLHVQSKCICLHPNKLILFASLCFRNYQVLATCILFIPC